MMRYLTVGGAWLLLALALMGCQGLGGASGDGLGDFKQGLTALAQQDPDRAIDLFTSALASGGLEGQAKALAHYNRGIAHSHLSQLGKSLADFNQALQLDPNLAAAYNNRGMVHYRLSQFDKAVDDLDAAIRLGPNSSAAYYNRSFPLAAQGKTAQAIGDLEQALKLSPGNDVYRNRLNWLLRPEMRLPKAPPLPGGKLSGSGFVVSPQGHVLTNLHVVKDAKDIRVPGLSEPLAVRAIDALTDLALLQMPKESDKIASFPTGKAPRAGDQVVVVGFPLHGLLAPGPSVSTGNISALAGPGNNPNLLQITCPVQPGNSGGPLLDEAGQVVGVVVGKLDAAKVAKAFGDAPQNVNFAISGAVAQEFLRSHGVDPRPAPAAASPLSPADIAEKAASYVVLLECTR
ncbi:MAG: trypsin-like peptidase domain-containing protein [Desulfarculus sp.]|nr:trypsin-like peptidase domain-containing protein [Desulfarculus sp.]